VLPQLKSHFHYLHSSFRFHLDSDMCTCCIMIACRNVCVWSNYYNLICSSIQIFVATSQSYLSIPSKKEEHLGPVDDSYGMHGKRPRGLDTWEWNWYEGASVGETTSAGFNQTNCRCNNMNPLAEQISFSSLSPQIAPQKSRIIIRPWPFRNRQKWF